jgi:ribonuclease-3
MKEEDKDFWKNHLSYANEHKVRPNDSLATLGDSVLDLIVAEYFYYKNLSSGQITLKRSKLVSDENLARVAKRIGFDKELRLSKGADHQGARENVQVLEQIFEAHVGFKYLHEGLEKTREYIMRILIEE